MWKPIILDVECIVCNKSLQKINHDPREVSRKMGKIANRRSRTPNWSVEEKQYLLELINARKVVITRTTNGPNHYEEKDVAWNEILSELAKRFGNKFSGSSIKKVKTQWQNMKRIAREEITLNGPQVQKYSKQSLQVCNILDLVKDGVLKNESEGANASNETVVSNISNIEIKAERIDEDINQPSCSTNNFMETEPPPEPTQNEPSQPSTQFDSSSISSDHNSEAQEYESQEQDRSNNMKNVSANTDSPSLEDGTNIANPLNPVNPFHRNFQEFIRFSAAEKQIKMEAMREERQVVRAMRETAELNKIIAEQRLKHILWIKKQEMAMYTSGEPGSGAGRGGGGGGSIREAGGAFGKREAAKEEEYFYRKQREQLKDLKDHLGSEISFHEEQIKRHEDAIRRHKKRMNEMEPKE